MWDAGFLSLLKLYLLLRHHFEQFSSSLALPVPSFFFLFLKSHWSVIWILSSAFDPSPEGMVSRSSAMLGNHWVIWPLSVHSRFQSGKQGGSGDLLVFLFFFPSFSFRLWYNPTSPSRGGHNTTLPPSCRITVNRCSFAISIGIYLNCPPHRWF